MSDLYKEALLDAKRLKEVAEIDAKNRIMERISPVVKEMISKEIRKGLVTENFFTEQEEEETAPGMPGIEEVGETEEVPTATVDDGDEPDTTVDPSQELPADLGNQPASASDAPITVAGSDLMQMTVPDEEGKITVDFNDLFVGGGDEEEVVDNAATEEAPVTTDDTSSVAPEVEDATTMEDDSMMPSVTEAIQFNKFRKGLLETSHKIDMVYFRKRPVSSIAEQALKNNLFSLMEQLDSLSDRGILSKKETKNNENKLDFLFSKLKEATSNNSYMKTQEENNDMASLKEFAARLFEEDEMADHAKEQSGVSPELGGEPEDLDFSDECVTDAKPVNSHWADAEPLSENSAAANSDANDDIALGSAGFGDTDEEPSVEFEIDERELMEAIRKIRKENKEKSWEDGKPEGGKEPALCHLDEQLDALESELDDSIDSYESDLDDVDGLGDVDGDVEDLGAVSVGDMDGADLTLSIDLPDELEALLADFDQDDFDVDVAVAGAEDSDDDADDSDDSDEEDEDEEIEVGGEEEELLLDDGDDVVVSESRKVRALRKQLKVYEARLARARRLLEAKNKEAKVLETQLLETNLFTAKTVYLNKFLMREGLSKATQRSIVEFLDKAKTIAEAKAVYGKIKNRLNESKSTSRKLVGSSSKVATPGSVKLHENSQKQAASGQNGVFNTARWKELAKIK